MPSKKKKYNARFPAGRIKKIMQTDEEVGKVAQAVPVIISRTLELFVESLLKRAMQITSAKNAKTLTPSHMKQCILSENRFDFLKDLVKSVPDVSSMDDDPTTPIPSPALSHSGRPNSGFSGFQFKPERRRSDCYSQSSASSASSTAATSHILPSVVAPLPSPSLPTPRFYQEIPIGSQDNDTSRESEPRASPPLIVHRAPVIQHTANHIHQIPVAPPTPPPKPAYRKPQRRRTPPSRLPLLPPAPSSSSEEEEAEENGFHRAPLPPRVTQTAVEIDDDYDT